MRLGLRVSLYLRVRVGDRTTANLHTGSNLHKRLLSDDFWVMRRERAHFALSLWREGAYKLNSTGLG